MRNVGHRWQKWFTCDRCGGEYPEEYKAEQNGLTVCTYLPCLDVEYPPPDPKALEEKANGGN